MRFVEIHTKPIRDMKFHPKGESLLLTASMDKTIKLTNSTNNCIVATYTLDTPTQACEWNHEDPNYFFCGQNRCILMFDVRKTNTFVSKMNGVHQQPVHSLSCIFETLVSIGDLVDVSPLAPVNPSFVSKTPFNGQGLVSASPAGICFWSPAADNNYQCSQIPLEGTCTSVTYDSASRSFLSSFRSTPVFSTSSHTVRLSVFSACSQLTGF
jgi:WD40 repeat protein